MANLSRSVAVASGVLGILILICGVVMIICGAVWMGESHKLYQELRLRTALRSYWKKFDHLGSAHGLWSGALFITGGAVGIVLFKQPTKKMVVVFLVMSCVVSLVGWIEVGLLADFFTHPLGQAFDLVCSQQTTERGNQICKFMATLRGVAAFSGIGACLAIGGIIAASVGLCGGQNTGSQSQQQFQQPQGPVVVMQVGQGQQQPVQVPMQYHPGSYVVAQSPPGQVAGQYNTAMAPADQKAPFPPAYAQ